MSFSVIAPVKRCSDFARGVTLEMETCLSADISSVVASKGFKNGEDERHIALRPERQSAVVMA